MLYKVKELCLYSRSTFITLSSKGYIEASKVSSNYILHPFKARFYYSSLYYVQLFQLNLLLTKDTFKLCQTSKYKTFVFRVISLLFVKFVMDADIPTFKFPIASNTKPSFRAVHSFRNVTLFSTRFHFNYPQRDVKKMYIVYGF